MAYRITATTDRDTVILENIRHLAWEQRTQVSAVIRQAFLQHLYGPVKKHWPEEYREEARPHTWQHNHDA